jgi:hypothetical protein
VTCSLTALIDYISVVLQGSEARKHDNLNCIWSVQCPDAVSKRKEQYADHPLKV